MGILQNEFFDEIEINEFYASSIRIQYVQTYSG